MQEEGFPTLEEEARAGTERAERSGGLHKRSGSSAGAVARWGGEARKIGVPLARARDGVPQGARLPCFARSAGDIALGSALRAGTGPSEVGAASRRLHGGCSREDDFLPAMSLGADVCCVKGYRRE